MFERHEIHGGRRFRRLLLEYLPGRDEFVRRQ